MNTAELLKRRQKRALAIILAYKEQHIDPQVTRAEAAALRKVILDQFNEYYNLVIDVFPAAVPSAAITHPDLKRLLDEVGDIHTMLCPEIPVDPRELDVLEAGD